MTKALPKSLQKVPFTLKDTQQAGLNRYQLRKLIESEAVTKIGRNLYVSESCTLEEENLFESASLRMGRPSAICLISALSHYGLIDEIPNKTWILVPDIKRTNYKDLRLVRSRRPEWSKGIEKQKGYSITSLSRTLVDALIYKKIVGSSIALAALRRALSKKLVTLNQIISQARDLGVEKRIKPYIEALI